VDGPFGSDLKNEEYQETGVPLIQLNNIMEGQHTTENLNFISEAKAKELVRHKVLPGDIIIAKMAEPVARAAIATRTFPSYVIVADCIKLSPNRKEIEPQFAVYVMNSPYFRYSAELMSTGTTRIRNKLRFS